MNGFLKNLLNRMNKNTRTIKNILETIKKKAKKIYYSNKNMEYYERYNWKIKNKIDQSST